MKTVFVALVVGLVGFTSLLPVWGEEPAKFQEKVLWSFGGDGDGWWPQAALVDVKGTLYGTTNYGGKYGGAIFGVDPNTDAETVLYSLDDNPQSAGVIDLKGTLYGTTAGGDTSDGTVFSFDLDTEEGKTLYNFCSQQNCADGAGPSGSLIAVKGTLYGLTGGGGHLGCGGIGCGTLYSIDPGNGAEKVLYDFLGGTDAAQPLAGLIYAKGMFYGVSEQGGNTGCTGTGCGTVFSFDPGTGAEKVLYSFCGQPNCTDGAYPSGSLIYVKGILYGTTGGGGSGCSGNGGCGTVYSIDAGTGAETVLYNFCTQQNCADGAYPLTALIAAKGRLYGTTLYGGASGCNGNGCGTAFSLDLKTGAEKVIYAFCTQSNCTDGAAPQAGLLDVNGTLFGTTEQGGDITQQCGEPSGCGTVFALQKN